MVLNKEISSLTLAIESTDNAAFDLGNRHTEIARIIADAAARCKDDGQAFFQDHALRDINGNQVGFTKMDKTPFAGSDEQINTANFRLTLNLTNDAFAESWREEVSRLLLAAAKSIGTGVNHLTLRDLNGNTVGQYQFVEAPVDRSRLEMAAMLRENRVYFADNGWDGIADGEYRYAVTHADTPVGYRLDVVNVWLVNAAGEPSDELHCVIVKEHSLTPLNHRDIELLEKVIRNEVSVEEHERNFEESDAPSM